MKRKKIVFIFILLLFFAPLLFAEDSKKEIPVEEAMKALCGTWFRVGGRGTTKDIYKKNGTYEWYYVKTSVEPDYTGTFKIEKASIDQEGNIYCIVWRSYERKPWALYKVSNSGTVLESSWYSNANDPPTKISPINSYKFIKKKAE